MALPASMKVHPVFNVVKLRSYIPDPIPRRQAPPPPPIVHGDNVEYEVEKILDSKLIRGKLHYKVKWKGYPLEECTSEPAENLTNASKLVKDFHSAHPSAPRKISALDFGALPFKQLENFTEVSYLNVHDWTQGK